MGFIVYNTATKHVEKYYKTEKAAKSAVTRMSNQWFHKGEDFAICSYRDYEGFLQGMSNSEHALWKFFHQGIILREPK